MTACPFVLAAETPTWSSWVPLLALVFTVASFWWLWLRRGRLRAPAPMTYSGAFRGHEIILRLPLAIRNTGARPLVVANLRAVADGVHDLEWESTHNAIRPSKDDWVDFAAPFTVAGRTAQVVFAVFQQAPARWFPEPLSSTPIKVEWLDDRGHWRVLVSFDWWAPIGEDVMGAYLAHRNAYVGGPR